MLNRRLSPRIYLRVMAVVPAPGGVALAPEHDPRAIDYVVEMRRFDESRTLAARVTHGGVEYPALVAVGRRLAEFHAAVPETDAEELGRCARDELARAGGVIVDATFRNRADRAAFLGELGGLPDAALVVACRAPLSVRLGRARRRSSGASDATGAEHRVALGQVGHRHRADPRVVRRQTDLGGLADDVPPPRHVILRTDRPPEDALDDLAALLDSRGP